MTTFRFLPCFLSVIIVMSGLTACNRVFLEPEEQKILSRAARLQDKAIVFDSFEQGLCEAARRRDAQAQYKVASYYDSMIEQSAELPAKNPEEGFSQSEKAKAAAMYWYDMALFYGYKNQDAVVKRKALGITASGKEFKLYRAFSKNMTDPYCTPAEVFGLEWFEKE